MNPHETSREDEINQIAMERPHFVLLGAGASRAAFPNGEATGKKLPLMADFAEIVPIEPILSKSLFKYKGRNFEEVYSDLCEAPESAEIRNMLEQAIFQYFKSLALPPEPTLYDHLILSLRPKDVIATFNWDPFLIQAARRNQRFLGGLPSMLFLHGNVAAGYCLADGVHGVRGGRCSRCRQPFEPSPLLFPVAKKSYDGHPAIADAWRVAEEELKNAFMVTIFGYGEPHSDIQAMRLLLDAWGGAQKRSMEQFEIIDTRSEEQLVESWDRFIHTHHYAVHQSVYDSWLFNHPRRTGEAYLNQYLDAKFIESNPLPNSASFVELQAWFESLLQRERTAS